jgi:hypothetical protein
MTSPPDLHGWVPVSAAMRGGTLVTELCHVGARPFREPFFEDSIAICMRRPFNSVFRHRLDAATLSDWLQEHPGLAPSGFIFHMSRCGSTLVGQLLASSPAHRVISEAAPIDAALRAGDGHAVFSDETRIAWLQAMIGMLGQPGQPGERRFFVKFDSWHASLLPLIQRAFPEVPWLFMMRDPVEVIVSHLRRPGAQMVPGMLGFGPPGVGPHAAALLPRDEYCARMLGAICDAACTGLETAATLGRIVDYRALPDAFETVVLPHFHWQPDAAEREGLVAAWRMDAKSPHFEFSPDTTSKQLEASDAVRAAVERWVLPVYRRLTAIASAAASDGPRVGRRAEADRRRPEMDAPLQSPRKLT